MNWCHDAQQLVPADALRASATRCARPHPLGATTYYQIQGSEAFIAIPVRSPILVSQFPTFSVYEERMHSWVALAEGIEHMA